MAEREATRRRFYYTINENQILQAIASNLVGSAISAVLRVIGMLASAPLVDEEFQPLLDRLPSHQDRGDAALVQLVAHQHAHLRLAGLFALGQQRVKVERLDGVARRHAQAQFELRRAGAQRGRVRARARS